MRQIQYAFATSTFLNNINLLSQSAIARIPDPTTLGNIVRLIDPHDMRRIQHKMINRLLRMNVLKQHRLLERYYMIAIDMTGTVSFTSEHCPHCLTKERDGQIYCWYHPVVEAKLVTTTGLALSIDSEFVENTDPHQTVQDCELKAMYRLMDRLKKTFPQLQICVLLDGLYANEHVFELVAQYRWTCLITFKEGKMPDVWRNYQGLKKIQPNNKGFALYKGKQHSCCWVDGIEYNGRNLSVLEAVEHAPQGHTRTFVWLTTLPISKDTYQDLMKGGRQRWKIENQGFNMQKNGGYNLEHAYSKHPVGLKNFYLIMQIAHTINQLMEKGTLLSKAVRSALGSIKNIAVQLLEELRTMIINTSPIGVIKIRLDTS